MNNQQPQNSEEDFSKYAINEEVGKSSIRQIKHSSREPEFPVDFQNEINQVLRSWYQVFIYKEEMPEYDVEGLRPPQIGAVHAIHAHWAVSNEAATIVLPTGIGKTETMLSILIAKRCRRLLVVVPTDALRTQIAEKFLTLGILKQIGVVSRDALFPIVGTLKHIPNSVEEVDHFFAKCQVIVTTMKIVAESKPEIQQKISHYCPFFFVDEAHHVAAPTWAKFIERFSERKVLFFTATPFRNDGKSIGGKIIFNYPLRKAQEEGYFRPITFKPVIQFDPEESDLAIAEKAIEQLRSDLQQYNHILMARVQSIKRAEEVFAIYQNFPEFTAVQIHTGIKSHQEREEIRQKIINKQARIVICVDMLGEGFDLPELKIAAFHDVKKSLPVTLQLAGRFTRARADLGDPTFIANIADNNVQDELRKLYSQDADWNILLRRSSDTFIQEQLDLWELLSGFDELSEDIPLQNVKIAMSTVVYRTQCDNWTPENFAKGIQSLETYDWIKHDTNDQHNILIVLTAKKMFLPWIKFDEFFHWELDLYVVYWDKVQNLLFINQSSNKGYFKALAKAIAGDNVAIIRGNDVFRCLADINRLRLQNVGLKKARGRLVSYTMRAGSDVEPAITSAQRQSASKTNLFGIGFEGGGKVSIGCSRKGRIWSQRKCNIEMFTRWCSAVGNKLLNEEIDPDEIILRGTIVPTFICERPNKMPITIEWPETMFKVSESSSHISIEENSAYLHQAELELVNPDLEGDIEFEIRTDKISAKFALRLSEKDGVSNYFFESLDRRNVIIDHSRKPVTANQFFMENPPVIWFVDGSSLTGDEYVELTRQLEPYPAEKIISWDWSGTDITKESQGIEKALDSIQYRVIQELLTDDYDIVFDDDDKGEAADVVAIKTSETEIEVGFYHCKWSQNSNPGARIKDLYEVCGQAQKSIRWMENITELFSHLLRRHPRKRDGREYSRFEVGEQKKLMTIREMSRLIPVRLSVFIVQPGLSSSPSKDQLQLLSVTENHLMETYQLPFGVIGSN